MPRELGKEIADQAYLDAPFVRMICCCADGEIQHASTQIWDSYHSITGICHTLIVAIHTITTMQT